MCCTLHRLLGYCFYPFVVGYAEGVDRYARGQIGVYLARRRPRPAEPLPPSMVSGNLA